MSDFSYVRIFKPLCLGKENRIEIKQTFLLGVQISFEGFTKDSVSSIKSHRIIL